MSAPAVEPAGRSPRTRRGRQTRAGIVRAAREVFERDGFLDARITDISERAGVAHGTFYTYFATKEDALGAVLEELQEEMLHPTLREEAGDPLASIEAANRAYLLAYRRNARLMAVLEQVATIDDRIRQARLARNRAFAVRNAAAIRRLQSQGLADPDLDPLVAAMAMGGMVARMANLVFVHRQPLAFERLVKTLTRLWANAIGLRAAP